MTGSVESSNVDIATEFSNLIVAQQAYSANAKMVTTARANAANHDQHEAVDVSAGPDSAVAMSLGAALSIATGRLANVTRQLALVSHNVANASTPGMSVETATQQSLTAGGVGMGVLTGPATRARQSRRCRRRRGSRTHRGRAADHADRVAGDRRGAAARPARAATSPACSAICRTSSPPC